MYLPRQAIVETTGEILTNNEKVVALGIQGKPGTTFKINGGNNIVIGKTGIYELDLTNGLGLITSLDIIELPTPIQPMLVDILYVANEIGGSV